MKDEINTVGSALVGLAVVVVVLNSVFGVAFDIVGDGSSTVLEPAPDALTYVTDGSEVDDAFNVRPGTGTAAGFFADGYVDIPPPDAATRADGWALAATVEPLSVDPDNSHVIYAEDNATVLVEYEAGNYSARYETSSGDSAHVTAPASGGQQAVGVEYRNATSELRLYIDGTVVDTDTADATVEPRQPAYEWDGTIDEFRRWETPVGSATHAAYADDPVQVLNSSSATHRAMFNTDDPDEIYYANGSATRVGDTEIVDGVQPPDLVQGSDYEIATDPIRIRATSGGYLDGAPVVFVFPTGSGGVFSGLLGMLVGIGGSVLGLLVVGVLVAAAVAVMEEFNEF